MDVTCYKPWHHVFGASELYKDFNNPKFTRETAKWERYSCRSTFRVLILGQKPVSYTPLKLFYLDNNVHEVLKKKLLATKHKKLRGLGGKDYFRKDP